MIKSVVVTTYDGGDLRNILRVDVRATGLQQALETDIYIIKTNIKST